MTDPQHEAVQGHDAPAASLEALGEDDCTGDAAGSGQAADLALVMTGGGARAAYQVGFLRYLGEHYPDLEPGILTGVSAGAINAAHLGSATGNFRTRSETLASLWCGLSPNDVFRTDLLSMLGNLGRWAIGLLSGGHHIGPPMRGMVDTSPLRELLSHGLADASGALPGLKQRLASGRLKSVAVTTSDYGTGQSISWVQSALPVAWQRPHRRSESCELSVEHIMASAALPLLFPAVRLGNGWHGDGGIRLTAPLSPALHLGARRIIAISNRFYPGVEVRPQSVLHGYPPPAQVIGTLLNAIFLDMLDADAQHLERLNVLAETTKGEALGVRRVEALILRPSRDLGVLAKEFESHLPSGFRFLTRGFGTQDTDASDSLSLLLFERDFISALIELGFDDARAARDSIARFIDCAV